MMRTHLTDDVLMDLCEGTAGPEARAHAEACDECRARVAEAAEGLVLAHRAGVPEPSPLYWPALRRNVGQRIDAAGRPRRWSWVAAPILATASVIAVVAFLPSPTAPPPSPVAAARLPAWSALPPAEEDPGLPVLADVAPLMGDAVVAVSCQDVARCLSALDEEESGQLAEALRREWGVNTL
jgi:hypothetical protein